MIKWKFCFAKKGYALFSHCVVLFVGTFLHTSFDHFIFYFLWLTLSGAASLKLAYLVFTKTQVPNYKIPLAIGIVVVHMGFLLYLHFSYHELAEGSVYLWCLNLNLLSIFKWRINILKKYRMLCSIKRPLKMYQLN